MHPDIFKRVWNWSCVWHHLRSVFVISVEICVVIHGTLVSFFMNFRHITLDKTSQFLSSLAPLMCHSVAHFSRTMCEECCQKCGWNHTLQASFFKKINSLCQQNLLKTHFFGWFNSRFHRLTVRPNLILSSHLHDLKRSSSQACKKALLINTSLNVLFLLRLMLGLQSYRIGRIPFNDMSRPVPWKAEHWTSGLKETINEPGSKWRQKGAAGQLESS